MKNNGNNGYRWIYAPTIEKPEEIRPKQVWVPNPVHTESRGLRCIRSYVARLLECASDRQNLVIFASNERRGVTLVKEKESVSVVLNIHLYRDWGKDEAITEFFQRRQIALAGSSTGYYGYPTGLVKLSEYSLPQDIEQMTQICTELLQEVYDVTLDEDVNFCFSGYTVHEAS